jgi:hypothetical protein
MQPLDKHSAFKDLRFTDRSFRRRYGRESKTPLATGMSCRKRPQNALAMLAAKSLHKQETTTPNVTILRRWCRDEPRLLPKRRPHFTTIPSLKKESVQMVISSSAAYRPVS